MNANISEVACLYRRAFMHAFSTFLESWANTNALSLDGGVNVFVLEMDLYAVFFSVSRWNTTSPRNSYQMERYGLEGWFSIHSSSARAKSRAVRIPFDAR